MKRILLTSTALVMVAGIAAADGHSSIDWSGTAKAGIARAGSPAATAAVAHGQTAAVTLLAIGRDASFAGTTITAAEITASNLAARNTLIAVLNVRPHTAASLFASGVAQAVYDNKIKINNYWAGTPATVKKDAGDFKAYSEVNATVTGNVTAGGMTLSAGVSLDAGNGYDFADDDQFDNASASYTAGRVSLDAVSLDMGTAGKLTLNDDAVTHMVDSDDDGAGDVSYTNTFGGATFTAVMDLEKEDSDLVSALAVGETVATGPTAATLATATADAKAAVATGDIVAGTAAVNPDVQWSAKVAMPIGAGSVYVAMDEESGNAFGGSAVVSGMTLSIDSKLEALGADLKYNRANTLGVAMTMGAVNGKFTYDSIKDGNQWGVAAGYTAGDMSVAFATNEASSWSVTGGYALGTGASIEAGVNYTEDAFLGLSFAF